MNTSDEGMPGLASVDVQPVGYGLMSLLVMINCSVSGIGAVCAQLMLMVCANDRCVENGTIKMEDLAKQTDKDLLQKWLVVVERCADDFEWQFVKDRIEIIRKKINRDITFYQLKSETQVLLETIQSGLKNQLIYRYPSEKAAIILKWQEDWSPTIRSFQSARDDILACVDCWALGHHTASVFHAMRVLEHGLRALANDLGKTFDVQSWQNIIEEIESEIRTQAKIIPRGPNKAYRLGFLSEVAKEFVYFKDGWRNHVSHNRNSYDEFQSRSALEHVKSFMNVISSELHE